MEEVPAVFVGRASKSEDSQHTQCLDTASKQATFNKSITRKKSVFTLAAEFFKPNRPKKVEFPSAEHEKQERMRGQWNPFVSLRGFRDSRKKTADCATARGRSSSPYKNNESGPDQFGTPKAMRRKNLQDFLGTVGTKLSLAHHIVYSEDTTPHNEAPLEALRGSQEISPIVLPEPALPLPGAPNALLGSLCLYSKELASNEALNSHSNLAIYQRNEGTSSDRSKLPKMQSHGFLIVAAQPPDAVGRESTPKTQRKSPQPKHVSPSPSPERLCPAVPTDFLQDVSPQVPTHVRFLDEIDPPQYRYSDDFEDVIAPENANLDASFPGRALSREARYNSMWSGPRSECRESSSADIEKYLALTAAKMSKNLHLSNSQSRWSVDSSETDTDDMSDYNWVEKEMKVQDIIDRGKEIITLGTLSPYLHSNTIGQVRAFEKSTGSVLEKTVNMATSEKMLPDNAPFPIGSGALSPHEGSFVSVHRCPNSRDDWMSSASYVMRVMASEEPEPELSPSANLAMTDGNPQDLDEVTTQDIGGKANRGKMRVISLENDERFRPKRTNSRHVSSEPVHVVYPPSEFCEAHTKTYMSKSSAFGDLYQNHSGYSDYCHFDRSTRTYYPHALSDQVPEFLQSKDEKLEVLGLPLEMFPADPLSGQTDREDDCADTFHEHVSESDRPSSPGQVDVPNSDSDVKDSESAAFNKVESTASSSRHNADAHLRDGAWVGYTDSAPYADRVGGSQPNYTMTPISTREVSSSLTESFISEDLEPTPDDMDDSYKIAVDSATARLHLGSLFSSTESLRSTREVGVTHSNSVKSILSKLRDAQPEEAKHVKTWVEMELEFLDKFAPGSHMCPDRRGRIAVYEAFKKLKGLADSSDDDDALNLNDSDSGFQDGRDSEHEKWSRYREAYMGFGFEHVEDIAKCGPTRAESRMTTRLSHVRGGSRESLCVDPSNKIHAKGKGKESIELPDRAQVPSVELAIFRDCSRDMAMEQQSADPGLSTTEGVSKSHNLEADGTRICRVSNVATLGSHSRLGSEEYSDTDSTAITMLSGYMFTHYAEQLGEFPAGAHYKEQYHCENENCNQSILSVFSDRPTEVVSSFSMVGNARIPPPTELPEIHEGAGGDTGQLSVWPKNENIGLATAITVQVCQPQILFGLEQLLPVRSTSLSSGRFTWPQSSGGPPPSKARLAIRKRVLTPNKCISSPLTEFLSQKNTTVRGTSPSPSEADTEASENFEQKLQRYKRIEEEEKENDLWWTDPISYG